MELGTKWAGKQRSLKVGGDFTLKSETLVRSGKAEGDRTHTVGPKRECPGVSGVACMPAQERVLMTIVWKPEKGPMMYL